MLLGYGEKQVELELPANVTYEVLSGQPYAPLQDPCSSIVDLLRNPIGTPPLQQIVKPGETVCIIVNDTTRVSRSEIFLPLIINELTLGGVKKDNIFICFANGTHRPLSDIEMISLVGEKIATEIALFNHNCKNTAELKFFGLTTRKTPVYINKRVAQADRRILTGSVIHHYFAGFGGGRKALVPGVAGWETIQKNHSLLLDDRACQGQLEGNPVHEDLLEAANMVGGDFLLNTVLNDKKDILGVFAGDMVKAHLKACTLANSVYGIPLSRLADVVIASCGGYPKDINLYQAHKTLNNAISAMKQCGHLIFLAKCSEGVGSEKYVRWASMYKSLPELEAILRKDFVLGGHKAYTVAKLLQRGKVYLISSLPVNQSRMLGFIPFLTLNEALSEVYRDEQDLFTYVIPQGSITVPLPIKKSPDWSDQS